MKYSLLCLFFCGVMSSYSFSDTYDRSHPLGLDYWQPYGRFSMDYQTPHVKWGRPLAGGTIKALVLAPQWTFREAVELEQRLDVKITPWMCWSSEELYTNSRDPAIAQYLMPQPFVCSLLEKDMKESFDVYVIGKINWAILPAKSRFELLEKVSRGAGLVLVCPLEHEELEAVLGKHPTDDAKKILYGVPWQSLPRLRNADGVKLVQTAMFGKGRVVKLDYQQPVNKPQKSIIDNSMHSLTPNWVQVRLSEQWKATDNPEQELVPYEYYQSLVAKAVCWAVGRDDKGRIEVEIPNDIQAQKATKVRLNITPDNAVVRTVIRDKFGDVVAESVCVDGNLAVAGLSAGDYMLDIWALDKSGDVLNWGSWAFSVSTNSMIKDISLANRMFNTGDRVKGTIVIEGTSDSLRVGLWDNWGRKIDEKQIAIENGQASFDLGPLLPVTTMHEIRAELICNGRAVSTKRLEFPVRMQQKLDDFSSVIFCDQDNSYPTWAMLRKLRDDQADSVFTLPGSAWMIRTDSNMISTEVAMNVLARNVARAGLSISPYNSRFGCLSAPKDTHVVTSNWNMLSEEMLSGVKKDFTIDGSIYGPYGPYLWSHGDESVYSEDPDVDWSPEALNRFRQEAKGIYGSLEDLNAEWKTAYMNWEQVMPLSFEQAKASNNYAPWVVHRLSSDAVFAEFYTKVGDFLRVNDCGARTGFDGGGGLDWPNKGYDWWRLSKHIQVLQAYHAEHPQMEIFRSFAPADTIRGLWYGTYGPAWSLGPSTIEYCHYHQWYSIFHSLNSSWFWYNGAPGPISGYSPDMTSLPFMEAGTRALHEIKGGIGKLLLASHRNDDKIAIHFSESSRIVESFYQKNNDWCQGWVDAVLSSIRMLEDAGFQYKFVSYEQIENGELEKGGFKALFMPHSRAVSKREADQIISFAKNGGVVFADIVPGMYNSAGTHLKESLLKELFHDPNGKVAGLGTGKAVIYGESWNDYGRIHQTINRDWRQLGGRWREMAELLSKHVTLESEIKVIGKDIPPTEVVRFDAGSGVELVGLIRPYFLSDYAKYPVTIDFGHEGYLYDIRAGKFLGRMRTIPLKLDYQAQLFAVSPYRIGDIDITADENSIAIALRSESKIEPGKHVFRLSVFGPDGKERSWYAQNILAENGKAKVSIPFASNDNGEFTIKVRDVTSGVTAHVKVKR